jgi:membrane-bound metal-dependent hydrolase YbcI (DUF457 family)
MGSWSMISRWTVDRIAGWLGVGFLVALLASEAALSLPDERAPAATVASFYAEHRAVIIVLQIVGFASCALLALFAWRLRSIDRRAATAGLILAVAALAPGVITIALAIAANPQDSTNASTSTAWNLEAMTCYSLESRYSPPRSPSSYAHTMDRRRGGNRRADLSTSAGARSSGRARGFLDSVAPITFLVLIAALVWLRFRGYPRGQSAQ